MRFLATDEQEAFAEAVDELVQDHGGAAVAQQWASGDHTAGLALWHSFGELGLAGLRVAEAEGGLGGSAADLAIVFERLGYHAAPGPYLESVALLPRLVDDEARSALIGDGAIATASVEGLAPAALDPDIATHRFAIGDGWIAPAVEFERIESLAPVRRLGRLVPGARTDLDVDQLAAALDEAALASAAMLLGAGERLLAEAVGYAKIREQFGKPIGEYQSLKHQLADVRVALSFARPLIWSAATTFDSSTRARDVSAAKIAAGDAARLAARTSLQVHGAIGYTAEHQLGLWVTLVPALASVWGTAAYHRARVARSILSA
ncbi:acyl-CoA dehydrogenase family protein [Agromyces sp. NPDC058484]|uniref:acyl-CoA dehydrogenase family protein n=1 Tax=Agromyces sp. NPDC058484 TaxID=3346524 RepID=UPI0036559011